MRRHLVRAQARWAFGLNFKIEDTCQDDPLALGCTSVQDVLVPESLNVGLFAGMDSWPLWRAE